MPVYKTKTITTAKKTIECSYDGVELMLALNERATPTRVYFKVPSGGDYSGMEIEITKETPVVVVFETTEVKEDND